MRAPEGLRPDARQAIDSAAEDARGRGHRHLGTGHVLMGVLGVPTGPGARRLAAVGVTLHEVDLAFVRLVGYGHRPASVPGVPVDGVGEDAHGPAQTGSRWSRWSLRRRPLPMSSAARAVLHVAAAGSGGRVGTEHLVVGLWECTDGVARRILEQRGVTADAIEGTRG